MKNRLLQERDALIKQRDAIENQIAGLELAISLMESDQSQTGHGNMKSGRRTATKGIVLDLLRDVGTRGLNAQSAVDMANQRGVTLDRASVSSLLSRLKKDEIVVFDGALYRLKEFSSRSASAQVHEFPKASSAFQ